jgi:hypothetical protein
MVGGDSAQDQLILEDIVAVSGAYRGPDEDKGIGSESRFYLDHGSINLPYLEQERVYARFEGHPLGLKFSIEMEPTHKVKKVGLLERLSALFLSGFASGVDIDKLRTGKRVVAGLRAEEVLLRATDETGPQLSFTWHYLGQEDSGDHPEIILDMESKDGQAQEKMAVWDRILNSMKPVK